MSSDNQEAGIHLLGHPGRPWVVTKKEQYNSTRKKYKAEINDPHTTCCHALRTTHQLQKTVNKFNRELQSLRSCTRATTSILDTSRLERIKVSSATFTKIISDSDTYGQELSQIKKAYDHRLDMLLRKINHDVLSFTPQTQTRKTDSDIVALQQQIKMLESQGLELLKNNEKLNEEVTSEEELLKMIMRSTKNESQDSRESIVGDYSFDYSDKVSTVQAKIYHVKQEIQSSIAQRSGLVPISVCQKLEQCVRTCELDIQRIKKQNLILQNNIQEYENKLQRYLDATRTPPESVEYIWDEIQRRATLFANPYKFNH